MAYIRIFKNNKNRIITNPTNAGTYNHFSPDDSITGNIGHTLVDILPYFFWGSDEKILPNSSTPTDSTTIIDRIGRSFHNPEKKE